MSGTLSLPLGHLMPSHAPCSVSSHAQGPYPAMILREDDAHDLSQAMQKAPGASHSRGRTVLVENLSYSTSLSGLLRQFEGFHLQEHAATLLEGVRALANCVL